MLGAVLLWVIDGALGPSAVTLTLGPRTTALPPWYLPDDVPAPDGWTASVIIWIALTIGSVGLWIAMRALTAGWRPRVRRLIGIGAGMVAATTAVPPMTSADVLMYAAYGRLQQIGRNPYEITPAEIFRNQYDPVLHWAERPWTDTPSVYGPITSWTQLAANKLGGQNMHDIVFWLQIMAALAFVLACLGVIALARPDHDRMVRATLITLANPLLIWAVVAGAHNDAFPLVFAVGGMLCLRRSPFLAGLGVGLGGCAKLTVGIWGLAMLWAYRREPKKAGMVCLGAAIPMAAAYGLWQPAAILQVVRNGGYVSVGSWAHPLYMLFAAVWFDPLIGKIIMGVVTYSLMFVIIYMLSKLVPWVAVPGVEPGRDPKSDPLTVTMRTALVIGAGWLTTAMYTLSFYDLLAWLPLAVVFGAKLDRLFVLRGGVLSAGYVPGRAIEMGAILHFVSARFRDTLSPIVQMAVLLAILLWWKRPDRPELWPLRRARARSAAARDEDRTS